MIDDYAEVVRDQPVIVAQRGLNIVGMIVLGVGDDGFLVDNVAVDPPTRERESEALYPSWPRRRHGGQDSTLSISTPTRK